MELKADDETLQGLVSKALFDMLTPKKRDELLQGAIQSLLKREHGTGFNKYSEIQRLFAEAAEKAAYKIVSEKLGNDPTFETALKEVFETAWKDALTGDNGKKLAERLGSAVRQTITGDRY